LHSGATQYIGDIESITHRLLLAIFVQACIANGQQYYVLCQKSEQFLQANCVKMTSANCNFDTFVALNQCTPYKLLDKLPRAGLSGNICSSATTIQVGKIHLDATLGDELNAQQYEQLNKLRDLTFDMANSQGKYDMKPAISSLLMHVSGETVEAHVAYMNNNFAESADVNELIHLLETNNLDVFKKYFKSSVKSTFEDELADLALMVFSIAGFYGVDLAKHVRLKQAYNKLRNEHSVANDYNKQ
jgi:NTP pyrophosphatase (non-canonical NTP hydrolase)